jgi:glyoxalase family protein
MDNRIYGLHHVTAIAGDAQRNYEFYTKVLGLRLVKKTVNFDDPGTYHFYFGNETGEPGTILTFFPWQHVVKGYPGRGMAVETAYTVPKGSLEFWQKRFEEFQVTHDGISDRMGEASLRFHDPDGLQLALIAAESEDKRKPWETEQVKEPVATKGFHSTTLLVGKADETGKVLSDIFGYDAGKQEGNRFRFQTKAIPTASIIDIIQSPETPAGRVSGGSIHHIAFRVKNEDDLMEYREKVLEKGLHPTEKVDRNYFYSVYFREPSGVLFELATENPGFAIDESVSELGRNLKLPAQYEPKRELIEKILPPIH